MFASWLSAQTKVLKDYAAGQNVDHNNYVASYCLFVCIVLIYFTYINGENKFTSETLCRSTCGTGVGLYMEVYIYICHWTKRIERMGGRFCLATGIQRPLLANCCWSGVVSSSLFWAKSVAFSIRDEAMYVEPWGQVMDQICLSENPYSMGEGLYPISIFGILNNILSKTNVILPNSF